MDGEAGKGRPQLERIPLTLSLIPCCSERALEISSTRPLLSGERPTQYICCTPLVKTSVDPATFQLKMAFFVSRFVIPDPDDYPSLYYQRLPDPREDPTLYQQRVVVVINSNVFRESKELQQEPGSWRYPFGYL